MPTTSDITIRRARREDVGPIIAMLADDPLGGPRERIEDPLPQCYVAAFERPQTTPIFSSSSRRRRAPLLAACNFVLPGSVRRAPRAA